MDFAEYKDVLVVLELDEGKPVNVSLENIAAAKSVANGGKVIAVTVCENAAKAAIEYGADSAIVIEGAQFEAYNADAVADAVAQIAAEQKKIQAEGDAEATRIKAQAEADANREVAASLTPELIEKLKYEQWDGELPQVQGGSTPIVNLGE